jgi:FkbM family methyltransferase
LQVEGDDGDAIEFECSDTLVSAWTSRDILEGRTYPYLPFVRDVEVVFDVGANCGATTVHLARHYGGAEVHAFEPGSIQRAVLERNARAHPNVRVHPFGFHSRDQRVPLYRGAVDTGLSSVFPGPDTASDSETVELRAAGPWAAGEGIDRVDVLKVDTEGCELDVLESLAELLPTVKVLYTEYDSRDARRAIDRMLAPTHELYLGALFLDQGECLYLRADVADLDEARAYLPEVLRRRGAERPA